MNILAVTYYFPPVLAPATMRLLKWFKGLTEMGHNLTVLAVDPESFIGLTDEGLCRLIPTRGLDCRSVWSPEKNFLYRLMRLRGKLFYRFLQPRRIEWYSAALRTIQSIDLPGYDLLFTCSSPHSCHVIGREIKRSTGMPWVAFFSDPWADSLPAASRHSRRIYEFNRHLEAKVIQEADALVFTTAETVELVMAKYGGLHLEKCHVLPHCYVPEWYDLGTAKLARETSRILLLHTGMFYSERSALPFLRALQHVSRAGSTRLNLEIVLYGNLDENSIEYIRENRLSDIIRLNGTVSFLDSLALMKQADFLLLVDAPLRDQSQSVFLPSKLIDYIGSRRPVIGITPLSGASARVLRETQNIVCDVSDTSAIARTLEAVNTHKLPINKVIPAFEKYHYRNVVGMLNEIFEQVV